VGCRKLLVHRRARQPINIARVVVLGRRGERTRAILQSVLDHRSPTRPLQLGGWVRSRRFEVADHGHGFRRHGRKLLLFVGGRARLSWQLKSFQLMCLFNSTLSETLSETPGEYLGHITLYDKILRSMSTHIPHCPYQSITVHMLRIISGLPKVRCAVLRLGGGARCLQHS
jgi:hypothetical protein